jgi:hypothetical protein
LTFLRALTVWSERINAVKNVKDLKMIKSFKIINNINNITTAQRDPAAPWLRKQGKRVTFPEAAG